MLLPKVGSKNEYKALRTFVSNVRAAPNRAKAVAVLDAELSAIRAAFLNASELSNAKKCRLFLELVFMHLNHLDIGTTGAFEALNLLVSTTPAERCLAYYFLTVLFPTDIDVTTCIGPRLAASLQTSSEAEAEAALFAAANMTTADIVPTIARQLQQIANPANSFAPALRRKAYMALRRCHQKDNDVLVAEVWTPRLAQAVRTETDPACLLSLCALIRQCLTSASSVFGWEVMFMVALKRMTEIRNGQTLPEGIYQGVPSPWIMNSLMRILLCFPSPQMPGVINTLETFFRNAPGMQKGGLVVRSLDAALLIDTMTGIAHFHACLSRDVRLEAIDRTFALLAQESSMARSVAVKALTQMAESHMDIDVLRMRLTGFTREAGTQLTPFRSGSTRRQFAELLFALTVSENLDIHLPILMDLLSTAVANKDDTFMEELSLRILVLLERCVDDTESFVRAMLGLLKICPLQAVWYRAVHVLTGFNLGQELSADEEAAAEQCQFNCVRHLFQDFVRSNHSEETYELICYLCGEFGHLLTTEEPPVCSWAELAKVVVKCEKMAKTSQLRAMCITAAAKIYNGCAEADEKTQRGILEWVRSFSSDLDVEVQQRSVEFANLCTAEGEVLESILALMPAFPQKFAAVSLSVKRSMVRIGGEGRRILGPGEKGAKVDTPTLRPKVVTNSKVTDQSNDVKRAKQTLTSESLSSQTETVSSSEDGEESSGESVDSARNSLKELLPRAKPGDPRSIWRRACLLAEAPLMETPVIVVASRKRLDPQRGLMLQLLVRNVSSGPIIVTPLQPINGGNVYKINEKPFPPRKLMPKEAAAHAVMAALGKPAGEPVLWNVQIGDVSGEKKKALSIPLPVTPLSFWRPWQMSAEEAKRALEGTPAQAVEKRQLRKELRSPKHLKIFMEKGLSMATLGVKSGIIGSSICALEGEQQWSLLVAIQMDFSQRKSPHFGAQYSRL